MKRKLIEVALPLDAINAASAREKSIRHGHPSTLHLWWARRPLAACRAVLFAQLVDDPSSHPEEFPNEEDQDRERQRLFEIIEELVKWESTTNEEVLNAARAEILRSTDGNPPPILDPFAGGGSIPLEAQRLGLEAHASDLNPVAVLINKALIEIPPQWADIPPVHPGSEQRTHWRGGEGLAEDVRLYGRWMRDEAEQRIGHLYPKAELEDGSEVNVIAWIWARTVTCPNPACGATMPLVRSFWLGKKKGRETWVDPVVDRAEKTVTFKIGHGSKGPDPLGTVNRSGATCLVCAQTTGLEFVRSEGRAQRMGKTLMAVAAEGNRRRVYLTPDPRQLSASSPPRPGGIPDGLIGHSPRYLAAPLYGLSEWSDLFTSRQLHALVSFIEVAHEVESTIEADALAAGFEAADATAYSASVATYLAFVISRQANRGSTICIWDSSAKMEAIVQTFARQAIPMTWDFAEGNPFSASSGNFLSNAEIVARVLEQLPSRGKGIVQQQNAEDMSTSAAIATDPPYYDNIGYADLADFFYVWLRQSLRSIYPRLFDTVLTPKHEELIATPYRHDGSKEDAEAFFESGFIDVFTAARSVQRAGFPMTFFYAFRQAEKTDSGGLASTGWSTMLEGLLSAGWSVTATWPMRTELTTNLKKSVSALASSVSITCRPRPESAPLTDRHGFVRALREQLPSALHELQKANIAPVDLRQAAIGPGMAVFSSYSRVVEPGGEPMRVRTALGLINEALDQVLGEQEAGFDPDTRWAIQWFSQFFYDEGPYGTAEQLAVAMNISVDGLRRSEIVDSGGGRVRLLGRDEYSTEWDPTTDNRTPVWEACQHLVKRLELDGEAAAGQLLAQLGGLGESAQLLAYRLFTICEGSRPLLGGPFDALVASWPQIQHHARTLDESPSSTTPEQQTFDA